MKKLLSVVLIFVFTVFTFSKGMKSVTVPANSLPKQPIVIQGPMPIEAEYFAGLLEDLQVEKTGNFIFYKGTLNGYPIIVTKTSKGLENTAAATAIAIERYRPLAIINQGTSGGHDKDLFVGDIVLGKKSVNPNNLKTPVRREGEGSDPFTWIPMDIMASEGSAGEGDGAADAEKIRYYEGNPELLTAANRVKNKYKRGKVVEGVISSGNFWNNEVDRMNWLHENFGSSVEEMETAAAAKIAEAYKVPFLGIRVLSNNLTNNGKYDPTTAKDCQEFVKEVVLEYISMLKNN